ncbi:bis(5'-nucleosyl)-tetraphosphatase (symmetrical) YqeK [Listeria ivanovii]|uniref:bis(5'-nucleosyl)-tetraphosphatase (symmetrical) n=1 Tax=Listeria ivanovii (strain ATCC BAA-678 / PAM 55) TaxID=881621 RepID=G2Z935_LISIP|nr:bis(5'-nucleosyl)-tetraphosphatase (symmetrical) YqeK [Listeria ivanovii]AHI55983.1 phosphohydrolase [Listeria ivanovii WSLC3009]AIS65423.1 phosphohydrolase [Listeria ivanovii subsp. ivanovii]MBC1759334.1 HD domain-containing protein [Listeria ivanovii]MBK3914415.1 HD domain-containing protein [Listeria ivanovii subsp. ivanovii]MBK3921686.1 HD domain-containing protein [Listeria ivanovii subsp. ivanovii]
MERNEVLKKVEAAMPNERFKHTLGVEKAAVELAEHYHMDVEKARITALLHDYAKYYRDEDAIKIIENEQYDPRLLKFHRSLWHAPVGAYLAETEFGITDNEILEAIRLHTTGSASMTDFDKLIYLADYTEPGRTFPGVYKARRLALKSLDEAMLFALSNTITHLIKKNQSVFPDTLDAYNYFVNLNLEGDY